MTQSDLSRRLIVGGSVSLAAASVVAPSMAQQNPPPAMNQTQNIRRIPLQRFDVPGSDYETVIGIAEIGPDVAIGRHTHPGPESGYLIEGGFDLLIDGEQPKTLKAGDSYVVPQNKVHDAKTGPAGAKVIATYVVRKGQPIATPA